MSAWNEKIPIWRLQTQFGRTADADLKSGPQAGMGEGEDVLDTFPMFKKVSKTCANNFSIVGYSSLIGLPGET